MSVYYTRYFQREHYFGKLKLNAYKKALLASILAVLILYFRHFFGEGYESIKVLSENKVKF
jgi:CIC family chloride channel protein